MAELMIIAPSPEIAGKEFRDHHRHHGTADRQPDAGHDVGQRRGQDDPAQDDGVGATNDLPTSIKLFGTAVTPSQVLMQIGNSDIRNTTATLTSKPSPSHRTNSGTKATNGMRVAGR